MEKALRGNENQRARRSERRTDTASAPSEIREALGLELGHARRRFLCNSAEEFLVPLGLAGGRERPREVRQALVREAVQSFISRARDVVEELLL